MKMTFLLLFLIGMACPVFAQSPPSLPIPKIITDGFDVYKKSTITDAYDFWLAGSPLQNDTNTRANVINNIHTIEAAYGKFVGYEYIGNVSFSASTNRYYFAFLYEKGPLYAWFEVYSMGGKEIIPSFNCNTKADLLLPDTFFEKK